MIGVHLRRGDLLHQRPDVASNTAQAIAAVDQFLEKAPDAGVFLCTDDGAVAPNTGRGTPAEGVREAFRLRYGSRVTWTIPRSLDRYTPQAIQDALMDLWLLRTTNPFVGTQASSFSELAVFGRDIPHLLAGGATPGYQRVDRWAQRLGLYALLARHSRRWVEGNVPLPPLLRYYATTPYRWMRRVVCGVFAWRRCAD
jgi:hypothetical protein